jgi:tetratricopeptide (TPR) repeat protein
MLQIITLLLTASVVQPELAELVKQAQKLESSGKRKEALTQYRQILEKDPSQYEAHLGIGRLLDIEGQYAEARRELQYAIELAPEASLNQVLSTMAISYAFEGNVAVSAKYYQKVIERQLQFGSPADAANTANALGRVYLETGDFANAEKWYRSGFEMAGKAPKRTPADNDLAEMRWHHAQGRIAARRKQFGAARKHVEQVRAIVARGTLDEPQRANAPHLAGYVAFYEGNYDAAIAELGKADQGDPFILRLQAQSYEQKKDNAKAREFYTRILDLPGHTLQVAFARPLAARRLAGR